MFDLSVFYIKGPIGSAIINAHGCRLCGLIGGVMACTGLCLSYFTSSFYMILVFYGLLAGTCMHVLL